MSQRKERLAVIFLLYRHFVLEQTVEQTSQQAFDFSQSIKTSTQAQKLINILEYIKEIIEIINSKLDKKWQFERLSNFHKAILVDSTYEILWDNVPRAIIINEALEIAKEYGEKTDITYLNSVLDKVVKFN